MPYNIAIQNGSAAFQNDLAALLASAYSYESREKWCTAHLETEFVGTLQKGNRLYDLYTDEAGNVWYKTRIKTRNGTVSEYEAIFGIPEPRYRKKNRF